METPLIKISGAVVSNPLARLKIPVDFTLINGESIAIVGCNGSGKSLFAEIVQDAYPLARGEAFYYFIPDKDSSRETRDPHSVYENMACLAFRDACGATDGEYYYQQRWNSGDTENIPTVGEILDMNIPSGKQISGAENPDAGYFKENLFDIEQLADKKLIYLSSGELRKLRIVLALKKKPRVLIIDNPFIGLDAQARVRLNQMLGKLARTISLILVIPVLEDIPPYITHIIYTECCARFIKYTRAEYMKKRLPALLQETGRYKLSAVKREAILRLEYGYNNGETFYTAYTAETANEKPEKEGDEKIVVLKNVSLRYGKRLILDNVNWTVYRGERWALKGSNGSGKSTLLSLITADNPQSYACDIELFGRPRGSGESIWDIKKKIGYVSPEMHRAFQKNVPAAEIVASGLLDTIGLYVKAPEGKLKYCDFWMDVFGVLHLKDKPFLKLSSGEQRLLLLSRAFVKDPELLILDEPLHGLDTYNRALVKDVIGTFCGREGKTLIMVTHYEDELPDCIDKYKELYPPHPE